MAGPPPLRALSSLAREAAVRPGLREDKVRRFSLAALLLSGTTAGHLAPPETR